jgi:hypothetical protein
MWPSEVHRITFRPCLLLRFFWGWEGKFPAHDQIPKLPERPVYFSGIFREIPGSSPNFLARLSFHLGYSDPQGNPRVSFKKKGNPRVSARGKKGRERSDGGEPATVADVGEERRRRRGKKKQITTASTRSSSGDWSPVSSRASCPFPLLPRVSWCRCRLRLPSSVHERCRLMHVFFFVYLMLMI